MEEDDSVEVNRKRTKLLGFKPQKEIIYNRLLPYADRLDGESKKSFSQIKLNLSESVLLRDLNPGCEIWADRLIAYIKLYGLKFSKEDHVALVKLLYEVIAIPNLDCNKFVEALIILLKKKYLLSPNDIVLDWRPLHDLFQRVVDSKHGLRRYHSTTEDTLFFLIHSARHYFPDSATQEILDEIKPQLTANYCAPNSMDLLTWFLPISLPPEKAHLGYKLWLEDVMDLWASCNNAPSWEPKVMRLVANLASSNVGHIDWEPHVPMMFARFMKSFSLPVSYKQFQISRIQKTDASAIALWIVSALDRENSCQKYLEKFLKSIESYFHPANFGIWFLKLKELLRKLPHCFVQRLHYERYKKLTWETPVPESRKLTEEDIDRFVESMKGVAMQAVFSKVGCTDAAIALKHLATLRPKVIIPELIERFYSTLESVTEPHKFTSVMHCVAIVARSLVQGARTGYPEGPTHVIPLLMSSLPGIDPNDLKKCFVTLEFILVFVTLVPLVDSSNARDYWSDLTEEEEVICAATADFEDFVVHFIDRIFNFVESSSLEPTRMEKDASKRSKVEFQAETALTSVCHSVLSQCSTKIFKTALKKLQTFVTERIWETKLAGQVVATLCKTFSRVNPEETLKCLLPHFCDRILNMTESEEVQREEILDEELHYNLLILSELVDCRYGIVPYVPKLLDVMDRIFLLSSREGFLAGSKLLNHVLLTLTTICPLEKSALTKSYDAHVKDYLSVRAWGEQIDVSKLNLKWHVPGEEERKCVEQIVHKYLPAELEKLNGHVRDETTLSRTDLLRSLCVVQGVLGGHAMLPVWHEEPLKLVETAVRIDPWTVTVPGIEKTVRMPDGSNVKQAVAETMNRLQGKMLISAEDDIRSFLALIQIWERLASNCVGHQNDFDGSWKSFQVTKKFFENLLVKKKGHVRVVLIGRIVLQHESRMENVRRSMTETDRMIMVNLLELSCGHYSKVRMKAQSALFKGLSYFPFSYTVLIPHLMQNLQLDAIENHERFKGSLYVLSGPKEIPIVSRCDWKVLDLWLALVKATPSEKHSVIKLLDGLMKIVHKQFPTIALDMEISDECIERAKLILESESKSKMAERIEEGKRASEKREKFNRESYLNLLNSLMETIETNNLHWRYYSMALCFLQDLAHPDVNYPAGIVKTFLNTLIDDSIELRKIAIRSTLHILIQQKRKSKKVKVEVEKLSGSVLPEKLIPGIRPDNLWLQYDSKKAPKTPEEWDEPKYVHKSTVGYFGWPKDFHVYAPYSDQPSVERQPTDLTAEEREVFDFFSNEKNVGKLMAYFSLEEKKGKDKFNGGKFSMMKHIFKNHGDSFLHLFKPHLEFLAGDTHESNQRCAAEIIAGMIRGSKHWPFEKVSSLWEFLGPLIGTGLSNMTEETIQDWGTCFAVASENMDPNRNHWLLENLMKNLFAKKSSFLDCGRLFALQRALQQQVWKVAELNERILNCFQPHLSHPFQNVRERIGSALVTVFEADVKLPGSKSLDPHPENFMSSVALKLDVLYAMTDSAADRISDSDGSDSKTSIDQEKNSSSSPDRSQDKEVAFRLLKTVCTWIAGSLTKTHFNVLPEFYLVFPLLCSLENYDRDEELVKICSTTLAAMAKAAISPEHIPVALGSIQMVAGSGSWGARSSAVAFLEVFVFHNMPLLLTSPEWTNESANIVLKLLEDKRIEVREKAAEVLGGLIHCDFIGNAQGLLKSFKRKAKRENGENSDGMRVRHAAILGLCSFINSSPYDVPEYVPEIFFILGDHLNDPQPIPRTIWKTLGDFKRTHHDNWDRHQLKFTEKQLEVLNDINVPPSYFV